MKAIECRSCIFFAPSGPEATATDGECRRRAPMTTWKIGEWPRVKVSDFCGEHVEAAKD